MDASDPEFWDMSMPIVFQAVKGLYAVGWEYDDLINEARIGVWEASLSFKPGMGSKWYTYAYKFARRRVMDLVTTSMRKKHIPLRGYCELEPSGVFNIPEPELEINETKFPLMRLIESTDLTDLERAVIELSLQGDSYNQMAEKLGVTRKKIDNAKQRIMKKLRDKIRNPDTDGLLLSPSASTCA